MKHIISVITFLSLVMVNGQDASAFRCGRELVTRGDSAAVLSSRCGQPTRKEFEAEKYDGRWESVERWYYNCGERDFIYKFVIVAGIIKSEDSVGRGAGKSDCEGRK